ncbi:MAG TPA: hypothetical protein VEX16_05960 [Methyloceanibacter sp.]|nr:hypothetical protein [Methyloceanibacter sp.]
MAKTLIGLVLSVLISAGAVWSAGAVGLPLTKPAEQSAVIPVKVWRDCQRIARCSGCKPVYRCRSCQYQRTCEGGRCGWADVCVWGPYLPLAPKGVRIIN